VHYGLTLCLFLIYNAISLFLSNKQRRNIVRQKVLKVGGIYKIEDPPFDHAVFEIEEIGDVYVRGTIIVSVPSEAKDVQIQRTTNRRGLCCDSFVISFRIDSETRTMTWDPIPSKEALIHDYFLAIREIVVRAEL